MNNANLYRQSRDAAADAILCVFLAREMSEADGLSRLDSTHLSLKLQDARLRLVESIKHMRLGGAGVLTGADYIESPVMDQYRATMYQVRGSEPLPLTRLPGFLIDSMDGCSQDAPGEKIHQTVL